MTLFFFFYVHSSRNNNRQRQYNLCYSQISSRIKQMPKALCALHPNQQLSSYCQTCKDAVCQLCKTVNPHSNSLHDVIPIEDAMKVRKLHFQSYIENEINPLRERAERKIIQLKQYQEQVLRNEQKVIAKDIAIEFEGIEQRLKKKMQQQIIKCQTLSTFYQQYINEVDDLTYSFNSIKQQPYKFLMLYRQFNEKLGRLQAIQMKETSKPSLSQIALPREIAQAKEKAALLPKYKEKNNFLNQLIENCIKDYHEQIKSAKAETQANEKRIRHLYNDMNHDIQRLQSAKACAYCLSILTPTQINQPCSQNKTVRSQPAYSDVFVPEISRGGRVHYWVQARKSQRGCPSLATHALIRMAMKKQYFSSLTDLKQVKCQLRHFQIKEGIKSYHSIFQSHDSEGKGNVSKIAFLFIMTNKFEVEKIHVETLIQLLAGEGDTVRYNDMDNLLEDPLKLYRKFAEEEEQMEKAKPFAPISKFKY